MTTNRAPSPDHPVYRLQRATTAVLDCDISMAPVLTDSVSGRVFPVSRDQAEIPMFACA